MHQKHSKYFSALFLIVLIYSCALTENAAWKSTQNSNSIVAYKKFLRDYPNSSRANLAIQKIELLAFHNAEKKGEINEYQSFIINYPKSDLIEKAKGRVYELKWQSLKKTNTEKEIIEFINEYPNSIYQEKANQRLHDLRWKNADQKNEIKLFVEFIDTYPNSILIKEAETRLNNIVQNIKTVKVEFTANEYGNQAHIKKKVLSDTYGILRIAGFIPQTTEDKLFDCILKLHLNAEPLEGSLHKDIYYAAKSQYSFVLYTKNGIMISNASKTEKTPSYNRILFFSDPNHRPVGYSPEQPFRIFNSLSGYQWGEVGASIYSFKKH